MSITIHKYQPDLAVHWNAFIKQSINGTFLIERDFMEYHSDRFIDASFMVYDNDELVACLPGNVLDGQFYSHQGLTYGGVFFKSETSDEEAQFILKELISRLKNEYRGIEFRWQPEIYNKYHTALLKALEIHEFNNLQAFNNLHVDLKAPIHISSKKTVGYRNGKFDDLKLRVNHDFKSFWELILEPQLRARYDTTPVHSLQEIELLASRFPEHIKQYMVYEKGELLSGITFFIKSGIVKTQYASATPLGMHKYANDFIYLESIKSFKDQGFHIMDCGHVNNSDGSINRGLQRFKEQLGAVNQPVYRSQWTKR